MAKGKFKVFEGLREVFDEFLQYHRDENGRIYKVKEDLLDAIRYAYMMRRFAVNNIEDYDDEEADHTGRSSIGGY
jgi:hypothetical protein